jgi:hypothetical protein
MIDPDLREPTMPTSSLRQQILLVDDEEEALLELAELLETRVSAAIPLSR